MRGPLPDIWQNFTSLSSLTLHGWVIDSIPDWVVQLHILRRLDLPSAQLKDLNIAALLQLPIWKSLTLVYALVISWQTWFIVHSCLKQFAYRCHVFGAKYQDKLAQSAMLSLQSAFEVHDRAHFSTQSWFLEEDRNARIVQFKSCLIEAHL